MYMYMYVGFFSCSILLYQVHHHQALIFPFFMTRYTVGPFYNVAGSYDHTRMYVLLVRPRNGWLTSLPWENTCIF